MLWTVSGECRHVGKTHVCRELAAILPDAVYVKVGHNPRQAHKPRNYFTTLDAFAEFADSLPDSCRHCVVESGRMVREGRGDARIFLQAPVNAKNPREDAGLLRDNANLVVAPEVTVDEWTALLKPLLGDDALVGRVCAVLLSQQQYLM